MYIAQDSIYKDAVRNKIFTTVVKHVPTKGSHAFMTLCNKVFKLEKKLTETYPTSIAYCYERDVSVFAEIKKMKHLGNIVPINNDVFESSLFKSVEYSFVWLDFCNSYTDDFMSRIAKLVSQIKFSDRAVLSITLNKRRGQAEKDMVLNKYYPNYKTVGFAQHMAMFIDGAVKNVEIIQYCCKDINPRGAPMMVFNFLITKKK